MDEFNITIIGAGVVGLAVAEERSASYQSILHIGKNRSFGQKISNRNSEVIHAGIYYPSKFLKPFFAFRETKRYAKSVGKETSLTAASEN
ncbi:MAG: FAD-dependent oxidoreductase [Deltaproteobacteria bacterium]|nr:FAD-dependent oxidoreductase [Deltaproteobacteria bacterium]